MLLFAISFFDISNRNENKQKKYVDFLQSYSFLCYTGVLQIEMILGFFYYIMKEKCGCNE